MKFWQITILQVVLFLLFGFTGDVVFAKKPTQLDLNLGVGYRIDHLDWNISGGGINVLSELTWDDLRIQEIKGGGRFIIEEFIQSYALYMRGSATYGQIVEGENQDSDFASNNRMDEFSRSNNDADDGDVIDASVGIGLQHRTKLKRSGWILGIVPLVGYSYHEQNLKMRNGFQTIPAIGEFPNNQILNSSYDTMWDSLWIGLDLSLQTSDKLIFFGLLEYHWPDYHAEADWNLRDNFQHPVSFVHDATGTGFVTSVGWEYLFLPNLSINVALEYLKWSTDAGVETNFLSPQGIQDIFDATGILLTDGILSTPLNEVNWESKAFTLGIQYRFN